MEQETPIKINKMIASASQIAVVLPHHLNIDVLCAGLALHQKLSIIDNKKVSLFSSSDKIPQLEFITHQPTIYSSFGSSKELTIKVSGDRVKPKQLRYEKKSDDLYIYVTPQEKVTISPDGSTAELSQMTLDGLNNFTIDDVEVFPPVTAFDLIIILGADTLEAVGSLYEQNPEIFYHTTKVAISNKIEQEYFATLTWSETDVPSLSQLLGQWFLISTDSNQDTNLILKNDTITTSILAGLISATQSFSNPRTTPDTLALAAKLVASGARRQDVVKYLFKTKPFNLLQLWGRALARIKTFQDNTILYTIITAQDFVKSQTDSELVPQVVSEIISMANNYKLIILAAEVESGVDLLFAGPPHIKIKQIAKKIDPTYSGQPEELISNYQYLKLNLPNFKLEDLDQVVSTLSASSI